MRCDFASGYGGTAPTNTQQRLGGHQGSVNPFFHRNLNSAEQTSDDFPRTCARVAGSPPAPEPGRFSPVPTAAGTTRRRPGRGPRSRPQRSRRSSVWMRILPFHFRFHPLRGSTVACSEGAESGEAGGRRPDGSPTPARAEIARAGSEPRCIRKRLRNRRFARAGRAPLEARAPAGRTTGCVTPRTALLASAGSSGRRASRRRRAVQPAAGREPASAAAGSGAKCSRPWAANSAR